VIPLNRDRVVLCSKAPSDGLLTFVVVILLSYGYKTNAFALFLLVTFRFPTSKFRTLATLTPARRTEKLFTNGCLAVYHLASVTLRQLSFEFQYHCNGICGDILFSEYVFVL